ncbi:MAG: DUF1292 domain-containing protein [Anaerostipes sp.]|jgi:uncharacterized protein YrzB (UPF0473 family)|nr:DUF1292 domain-containing protein [Anaerostipes sp.]MDD3745413.1 DUF1292 domain-containing protein [Anaerostipes sp.]
MDEKNRISFLDDDGQEVEFMVIEQTKLAGKNYLLVADSLEEDGVILILKQSGTEDKLDSYVIVEDEQELEVISKIFNELLEDYDLLV